MNYTLQKPRLDKVELTFIRIKIKKLKNAQAQDRRATWDGIIEMKNSNQLLTSVNENTVTPDDVLSWSKLDPAPVIIYKFVAQTLI